VDVAVVDGCLTHLEINDRRPADQSAQPLPRRSVIVPDWLKIGDTVAPGLLVQKEM
jgi:hypothetical protein